MIKNISVTSRTAIVKHPQPIATAIQLPSVMINIKPVPAMTNTISEANSAPSVHPIHFQICEAIVFLLTISNSIAHMSTCVKYMGAVS